jgi:hypothetical protein
MCYETGKGVKSRTVDEIKIGCTIVQSDKDILFCKKKETDKI